MILGIDQGTTGTRARMMDASGRFLAGASRPHRQIHPVPGRTEHDPFEILQNLRLVIHELLERTGHPDLAGIGLSNQGGTIVVWNRATGEPVHPAIVWQDGLEPETGSAGSWIRWVLDHAPDARPALAAGELLAGTIDSWLLWNLTNRETFVTDPSTAARTGLYDVGARRWDPRRLELSGIPGEILPPVKPSTGVLARITGEAAGGGIPDGVPVVASLVHQAAAMAGQACLEPGRTRVAYGSGCLLTMNTGGFAPVRTGGLLPTVAWQRGPETTHALEGAVLTAGAALEWAKGVGLLDEPMVEVRPHDPDVIFVPALAGLASPMGDPAAAGAFLGLRLGSSRETLASAILEGVAARVVQVVRAMERAGEVRIPSLRVDGALARNAALLQRQADLLGIPVEVSAEPEGAAVGCSFLAARAAGLWSDDGEIRARVSFACTYEPTLGEDPRLARLDRFERAVRLVREFGA